MDKREELPACEKLARLRFEETREELEIRMEERGIAAEERALAAHEYAQESWHRYMRP